MALLSLPAVLLRSYVWSESSHVLRFLTPEHGVVAVMARGVRSRGPRGGAPVEIFSGGVLGVDLRAGRDLQGFRSFDVEHPRRGLARSLLRFGAGSFLADLVLRHGAEEGTPLLFEALSATLDRVETSEEGECVPLTVASGWRIVSLLGYTPELEHCVACGTALAADAIGRFHHGEGGVRGPECEDDREAGGPRIGPGTRRELLRMLEGEEIRALSRPLAHLRLLHEFITWHPGEGRPLDSFPFLEEQAGRAESGEGKGG